MSKGRMKWWALQLASAIDEWGHGHLSERTHHLTWWPFCDTVDLLCGVDPRTLASERWDAWKALALR